MSNPARLPAAQDAFAILTRSLSEQETSLGAQMALGEALIVRKADGRASDEAIESLILSHKLLGTTKWVIVHYIGDDNSPVFDGKALDNLSEHSAFRLTGAETSLVNSRRDTSSPEQWEAAWKEFWESASRNLTREAQIIRTDIERIRNHPRTPPAVQVEGYIRDIKLGTLIKI